jgi:hypothetical protein
MTIHARRVIDGDTPRIVCLCGSTRFADLFTALNRDFTLQGIIVLTVGSLNESEGDNAASNPAVKRMLDALHKKKIELADSIFVINKDGYIGESTKSEIRHAMDNSTGIFCLEPLDLVWDDNDLWGDKIDCKLPSAKEWVAMHPQLAHHAFVPEGDY